MRFLPKILLTKYFWYFVSFISLVFYLSPLFVSNCYFSVFDNLDSKVIWYKILANSGKIFSDNQTIIPNMMNGLPRASYGSEFDLLLWIYYFFEPKTAYIINEVFIHLIAFFSMFFLLKRYVVPETKEYGHIPVFLGSLYFAFLPLWSGSGASIAILPLATYSLLNIKNKKDTVLDWLFLILIPLYSSFILVFVFYILLAGIYFLYESIVFKKINFNFLLAILLFSLLYILKNYRLWEILFLHNGFVSHRIEFNVFYNQSLWDAYQSVLFNFLNGHIKHAPVLGQYILPTIVIGMLLSFYRRSLTRKESIIIWMLIIISYLSDIWRIALIDRYTIPGLIILSVALLYYNKNDRMMPTLMILAILLSTIGAAQTYEGFRWITSYIPLLNSINIRIYFLLPFVYGILLAYSIKVFFKKLYFSAIFSVILILLQLNLSLQTSFFTTKKRSNYATFDRYYATVLFDKIQHDINITDPAKKRFISYGIEPAVSLYNGLYTVDGYSTNYPLAYKYLFRTVQEKECLDKMIKNKKIYDDWGSKLYLLCMDSRPSVHELLKQAKIKAFPLYASPKKLCGIGVDYILSGVKIADADRKNIKLIKFYSSPGSLWDIWLYKLRCVENREE